MILNSRLIQKDKTKYSKTHLVLIERDFLSYCNCKKPIANILNKANIFKRFIDDIIWILVGKCITQKN